MKPKPKNTSLWKWVCKGKWVYRNGGGWIVRQPDSTFISVVRKHDFTVRLDGLTQEQAFNFVENNFL